MSSAATFTNSVPLGVESMDILSLADSVIMDYFLAGEDQQQTNQPNDLAGG